MDLKELTKKTADLEGRISGINKWIKENPLVTDPNAYEITDCNVSFAECLAEYKKQLGEEVANSPQISSFANGKIMNLSEVKKISEGIDEMEKLRGIAHHEFFLTPEANALFCGIKESIRRLDYQIPETEEMQRTKKELLCKSMSVPFYIWQVQRTEPEYQYDNVEEFSKMKANLDLYKKEGNTQFVPEIESLFRVIEQNYKYKETKVEKKQA